MHYFLFVLFLIMSTSLGGFCFLFFFGVFFFPKVCDLVFEIFRTAAEVQKFPDFIL